MQIFKLNLTFPIKWSLTQNVKAITRSIYTCFCVFTKLEHVREMWLKYSKSWGEIHRKSSKVLNSTFHIKCVNIILLLITALLLIRLINKQYFTTWWNSRISIIHKSNLGVYYWHFIIIVYRDDPVDDII